MKYIITILFFLASFSSRAEIVKACSVESPMTPLIFHFRKNTLSIEGIKKEPLNLVVLSRIESSQKELESLSGDNKIKFVRHFTVKVDAYEELKVKNLDVGYAELEDSNGVIRYLVSVNKVSIYGPEFCKPVVKSSYLKK